MTNRERPRLTSVWHKLPAQVKQHWLTVVHAEAVQVRAETAAYRATTPWNAEAAVAAYRLEVEAIERRRRELVAAAAEVAGPPHPRTTRRRQARHAAS